MLRYKTDSGLLSFQLINTNNQIKTKILEVKSHFDTTINNLRPHMSKNNIIIVSFDPHNRHPLKFL